VSFIANRPLRPINFEGMVTLRAAKKTNAFEGIRGCLQIEKINRSLPDRQFSGIL
jgi:hypothetical protein